MMASQIFSVCLIYFSIMNSTTDNNIAQILHTQFPQTSDRQLREEIAKRKMDKIQINSKEKVLR